MGIPGRGRRISIRVLHLFEFRDGRISRENVWIEGAAAIAQLAAQ
jgi:predicted ester cyclase